MKINILKNSLILIIALGVIAPSFNNISFASPTGPEGGSEVTAAAVKTKAATAAVIALKPHVLLCVPAPEGALTAVHSLPSNPVTGSGVCAQLLAFGVRDAAIAAADTGAKSGTFLQRLADFAAKISYVLFKKVILDRLVDALVNWINQGGQGGIIEDWGQFLDDSANFAAGEFIQQLPYAAALCGPLNLNLQLILVPVNKFSQFTCTLNGIVQNIDNFMENFRNGSWLAYQEQWYPRNNFYGTAIIAMDELARAEAEGRTKAQNEGLASKGFLSFKKRGYFLANDGNLDKDGKVVPVSYTGPRYKYDERIVTPGEVAAQATTEALITIPGLRLIHADDMSIYISAIIDASINQLTKAGIDGLRGLVSNKLENTKINPIFPCAGLTGESFRACINSINAEKNNFQRTQQDAREATVGSLSVRTSLANTLNQSIALQSELVEKLDQLITVTGNTSRSQELADEQATLDLLENKRDDNQTFLDALTAQDNKISGITPAAGLTQDDWLNLGNSVNTQFITDSFDANSALSAAQEELEKIQTNVNSKLPNIESQLPKTI